MPEGTFSDVLAHVFTAKPTVGQLLRLFSLIIINEVTCYTVPNHAENSDFLIRCYQKLIPYSIELPHSAFRVFFNIIDKIFSKITT